MRKGSITVFISLVLAVMISLIAASLLTVRVAADRMMLANCADQAMFSLFAQYDRDMLEDFDLFFLDGGRGASGFHPESLYRFAMKAADGVLHGPSGPGGILAGAADTAGIGGVSLCDLTLTGGSIDGYLLASDGRGAVFEECATAYMKEILGITVLSELGGEISSLSEQVLLYETEGLNSREDTSEQWAELEALSAERRSLLQEPEPVGPDGAPDDSASGPASASGGPVAGGEDSGEGFAPGEAEEAQSSVEELKRVGQFSVLRLVTTDPDAVSGKTAAKASFPSERALNGGLGILSIDLAPGMTDRLLFHEYLLRHFGNYREPCESGLSYPLEYLVAGRDSDVANLQAVANRLLLVREGANLMYLYRDPLHRSAASTAAKILSAVLLIPEAEPLIEGLLTAGWAYCESLIDVRGLLDGDRIPLVKTSESWQLPFSQIFGFRSHMDDFRARSGSGMEYRDYLRVFLFLTDAEKLRMRTLDMAELRIRESGRPRFQIDSCIVSLTVYFAAEAENRFPLQTEKTYDYRTL